MDQQEIDYKQRYFDLTKKYKTLAEKYQEVKKEHDSTIRLVMRLLTHLGVLPYHEGKNIIGGLLKHASRIATDAMVFPDKLRKEFEYFVEFMPLIEKYGKSK